MPARHPHVDLYQRVALRLRERFLLLDVDWIYELVVTRPEPGARIDEVIDYVPTRKPSKR